MLRKIKLYFTSGMFGDYEGIWPVRYPAVVYQARGINTGFTSPSDCVWLVP